MKRLQRLILISLAGLFMLTASSCGLLLLGVGNALKNYDFNSEETENSEESDAGEPSTSEPETTSAPETSVQVTKAQETTVQTTKAPETTVQSTKAPETEPVPKIAVPSGASDYYHQNYRLVIEELREAGFTEFTVNEIQDLTSADLDKDDKIEKISIAGSSFFSRGAVFPIGSEVKIEYHSVNKYAIPVDSSEAQSMTADELLAAFEGAGFSDITVEEIVDIDPKTDSASFRNDVTVNGSSSFRRGDAASFDAKVKILTHLPLVYYKVVLDIRFPGNLLFSRYDVELLVNGEKVGYLRHGKSETFEIELQECEAVLLFRSATTNTRGETTLKVYSDLEARYKISTSSTAVSVEQIFVDRDEELPPDQIKMKLFASEYESRNYLEVENELRSMGFTNVVSTPVYDLYSPDKQHEQVSKISINGVTNFKRADVFRFDVPVEITYRMYREEDPAATTRAITTREETTKATTKSSSAKGKNYSADDASYKDGNTGQYSYVKTGRNYDSYYIIDFDEGYVYRFTEGNSEGSAMRIPITKGDLNSVLIITYHVDDYTWQEGLCFKFQRNPDKIDVQQEDGTKDTYYETSLNNALKLLETKTIVDY